MKEERKTLSPLFQRHYSKTDSQVECKCLQPLYWMGNQPIAPLLAKEVVLFARLDVVSDVFRYESMLDGLYY